MTDNSITSSSFSGSFAVGGASYTYTHDADGNLTSDSRKGVRVSYSVLGLQTDHIDRVNKAIFSEMQDIWDEKEPLYGRDTGELNTIQRIQFFMQGIIYETDVKLCLKDSY